MVKTDLVKTIGFVISGVWMSIKDQVTPDMAWKQVFTPYFLFSAIGGAALILTAYWMQSPVPVAGKQLVDGASNLANRLLGRGPQNSEDA